MRPVTRALTLAVVVTSMLAMSFVAAQAAVPTKTKPTKWASQVCTSLDDWVTTIESAATTASATPPTSIAEGKKALVKLLGSTIGATKKLVGKVKKAGTPAVADGATAASILKSQLSQVLSAFTSARTTIKQIPVDDPVAFVAQSRTAQDVVESSIEQIGAAVDSAANLDDPALVAAFNDEDACASITG